VAWRLSCPRSNGRYPSAQSMAARTTLGRSRWWASSSSSSSSSSLPFQLRPACGLHEYTSHTIAKQCLPGFHTVYRVLHLAHAVRRTLAGDTEFKALVQLQAVTEGANGHLQLLTLTPRSMLLLASPRTRWQCKPSYIPGSQKRINSPIRWGTESELIR
jgi:hypothetical protein